MDSSIKLNNRIVQLTHQDKIIFKKPTITKSELIEYYKRIALTMLPYMKDRAVTMHRFPNGINKEGFYQKDIGNYFPSWLKRVKIKKEGGKNTYAVCNNAATLVYLANQCCITPHIWLSRIDKINYPDKLVFDLDPGKQDFRIVKKTAIAIKDALDELGLKSWVMTTGSKGIHVVVPLDRKTLFDDVRAFARRLADKVALGDCKYLTTQARIAKRHGRLYIDATRNAYAQTTVAPYAVRALPGAPVATPLRWDELTDGRLTAQRYTIKNVFEHLKKHADPWKDMIRYRYSLKSRKNL